MLVNILLLIAVFCVAVNAGNLRADQSTSDNLASDVSLHSDPLIGQRIFKQVVQRNAQVGSKVMGAKMIKLANDEALLNKNSFPMSTLDEAAARKSSNGYYFFRTRPSNDCSGNIIVEEGLKLGECLENNNGGSRYFSCGTSGPESEPLFVHQYPNSRDCTGYSEKSKMTDKGNQCDFNYENVYENGLSMISRQCSNNMNAYQQQKPGLMEVYYTDSSCSAADPYIYRNHRFDSCKLFVDYTHSQRDGEVDERTQFWYIKFDSCSQSGKVLVHMYSDSLCTRKKYFTHFNVAEEEHAYENCVFDNDAGMYTKTICKRQ